MPSRLNPYISFSDNAARRWSSTTGLRWRASREHLRRVWACRGRTGCQPDHAREARDGERVHADGRRQPARHGHQPGNNMAISLSGDDADELRGYWEKLSAGGNVSMPLEKQMWGDEFGMWTDQFGVAWMVNITQPQA